MSNNPLKLISPERVKTLLECYGADPSRWPSDERSAAVALLNQSTDLQAQQQHASRLDDLLHSAPLNVSLDDDTRRTLVSRIAGQLPAQSTTVNPHRSNSQPHRKIWSVAAAATIALLSTPVFIQMQVLQPTQSPPEKLALVEYEQWLWEDITGDAVTKDNDALDFMALIELEPLEQ